MCIIYDVSLSFTFQVPPVGFLPVCDRRWTRETWWPLVSLLHKLSLDPETLCTCDVVGVCPWYDLRWVSLVGARPIDGRGVLSICWQFCRFWWSCMSTSTQTSCYVMVILGWGWVGWGNDVQSCQLAHTRHATLLLCSLALAHTRHATLWWSFLALAHTRHATLWWSSLALAHTRHATLWWSSLALAHTRHATLWWSSLALAHTHVMLRYCDLLLHLLTHVMLRYGDLLLHLHTHVMRTIVFADGNRAWESHAKSLKIKHAKVSHQNKEWTKQMRRTSFFFLSTVAGTQIADRWWKGLSKTVVWWSQHKRTPWIGKVCLGLLVAKIFGTIDTSPVSRRTLQGRQSNEALLRRRKKVLHPKKTRTYVKKQSSFGDFKTLFFMSEWEKMTFRCSENDIFVDEKLLKPYGRLWVGNHVIRDVRVSCPLLCQVWEGCESNRVSVGSAEKYEHTSSVWDV